MLRSLVVVASAGSALVLTYLQLPDATRRQGWVQLVLTVAFVCALWQQAAVSRARAVRRYRDGHAALALVFCWVVTTFRADPMAVGVHFFRPTRGWSVRRLESVARIRAGSYPTMRDTCWTKGKGVVGRAWQVGERVVVDWPQVFASAQVRGARGWRPEECYGLSWDELQVTAGYQTLVAEPVRAGRGKIFGVLAVDGPITFPADPGVLDHPKRPPRRSLWRERLGDDVDYGRLVDRVQREFVMLRNVVGQVHSRRAYWSPGEVPREFLLYLRDAGGSPRFLSRLDRLGRRSSRGPIRGDERGPVWAGLPGVRFVLPARLAAGTARGAKDQQTRAVGALRVVVTMLGGDRVVVEADGEDPEVRTVTVSLDSADGRSRDYLLMLMPGGAGVHGEIMLEAGGEWSAVRVAEETAALAAIETVDPETVRRSVEVHGSVDGVEGWRRVRDGLPSDHPAGLAIDEGLRR